MCIEIRHNNLDISNINEKTKTKKNMFFQNNVKMFVITVEAYKNARADVTIVDNEEYFGKNERC